MRVTDIETYTTVVYTIEDSNTNKTYMVTEAPDNDIMCVDRYHMIDVDTNDEVTDGTIIEQLRNVVYECYEGM